MSTVVLMAGGTGGHLFPAMALAQELRRRGHVIHLITDHRVGAYGEDFPAEAIHIVPSATPSIRNPLKFLRAGLIILGGTASSARLLRKLDPAVVVGFGGYPTFPPLLAASMMGIPGVLHEANAVLGRANRALVRFTDALALSFEPTRFVEGTKARKVVTGNPIRDRVRAVLDTPYPGLSPSARLRLLVFGGSQGARAFADLLPQAIALLPEELRMRLDVTQQCRPEDLDRVAEAYRQAKVNVELAAFFTDLPERMAHSHLVVCRSGASSVSELCAIGRPSILIPLPGALDADQKTNAGLVQAAGGGWIAEQATLSPQLLATRLTEVLGDAETLRKAAQVARGLGRPQAVEALADLAESLIPGHKSTE